MLNSQILFCLVTMFGNERPEVMELSEQTNNEKQAFWQLATSY